MTSDDDVVTYAIFSLHYPPHAQVEARNHLRFRPILYQQPNAIALSDKSAPS